VFRSNKKSIIYSLALISSVISPICFATSSEAVVNSTVASIYMDQPFVQGSYAVSNGGVVETFQSYSPGSPYTVPSGTNLQFGTGATVGTTTGSFNVYPGDAYGATTTSDSATVGGTATRFAQVPQGTNFTISFVSPVKYIGFHWNGGDSNNKVTFFRSGNVVASMTTADVTTLVGANPSASYATNTDSITAASGSRYYKKYYRGPNRYSSTTPTSCSSVGCEPFAYVHAFASNGQAFDSIKFEQTGTGGFEFDNLTVSTQDVPIRDSLVFVSNVQSSCNVVTNNDGNGVTTIKYTGTSLCTFSPPSGVSTISIIAVAGGGGGGGACVGGGGGAGGFYRNTSYPITGNLDMLIGAGGTAGSPQTSACNNGTRGGSGSNTTLTLGGSTQTISGGGGGGTYQSAKPGVAGGSGGGGAGASVNLGGTGTSGQGNNGGSGSALSGNPAGGGGGYSSAGSSGTSTNGGAGGSGISITVFGALQRFSGGGGGSSDLSAGAGGESCGGNGAGATTNSGVAASAATAATGFGCGGGGGDGAYAATAGSAGVVFISYVRVTSISWLIGGTTGSGTITEISWTAIQAATRTTITLKRTLTSEATSRTPGTMAILQATLDDASGISCGTYTSATTFTMPDGTSQSFSVVDSGSISSSQLARGYCYQFTEDPNYLGAARPTDSDGLIFSTNLTSQTLVLPKRPSIKIPTTIPVNPRNKTIGFPTVKVGSGSGRVLVCIFENNGSSVDGAQGTPAITQSMSFASKSVIAAQTDSGSNTNFAFFYATTTSNLIGNNVSDLKISLTNGSKASPSRYVLMRLAPYLGPTFNSDCKGFLSQEIQFLTRRTFSQRTPTHI
jgi:hypothetical protein